MHAPSDAPMIERIVCAAESMRPTVRVGDAVDVHADARVRVGDVVTLGARGRPEVLHRIVARVPFTPLLVHCGDAPAARPALARTGDVSGVALLERRRPSPAASLRALLSAVVDHGRGRLRRARGSRAA